MTFLRLILILAVATSAMGAGEMVEFEKQTSMDCCKSKDDCRQEKDAGHDCGGACLMTCCRTLTAPADPVTTPLAESDVSVATVLPPLLVNDLGEPPSIFHPPRV